MWVIASKRSISLRGRFWWVALGLVTVASIFFAAIANYAITPVLAQQAVRMNEENKMLRIALESKDKTGHQIEAELRARSFAQITLIRQSEVEAGAVSVAIPGSDLVLVSQRPLTVTEARKTFLLSTERQLLALFSTLVVLYFIASKLAAYVARPLGDLTEAVKALAQGQREVAVPVPEEAELAELAESFNRMAEELNQRETELKQALQAKERIFATTSHELRTPLTVILGYCQMLEDGLKGELNPSQGEVVQTIQRNAKGLLKQVEVLLTLSQLRAKSLPFEREEVDLVELVEQVADSLSGLAAKKGLEVVREFPSTEVNALIDARAGEQILSNLVANAIKYTSSGEIRLSLSCEDDRARLTVNDSGPGIPQDFIPQLFQEFSRGPDTEGIEGNGLGLALSRQLAESMGGKVELLETSETGSSFCWSQPLAT